MKDLVCSVALGKLDKELVVDLTKEEEDFEEGEGATDFAIAKLANHDEFSLMQMDGKIQPDEIKQILEMAREACNKIYEIQKNALKETISGEEN